MDFIKSRRIQPARWLPSGAGNPGINGRSRGTDMNSRVEATEGASRTLSEMESGEKERNATGWRNVEATLGNGEMQ